MTEVTLVHAYYYPMLPSHENPIRICFKGDAHPYPTPAVLAH